jgi:hypothetical protein
VRITYCDDSGNEIEVPIIDVQGKPTGIVSGCIWANWTFRAMSPDVKEDLLLFGLKRYTANWLGNLNNGARHKFRIYSKTISVPLNWEPGILTRELSNYNWRMLGEAQWDKNEFSYNGDFIK